MTGRERIENLLREKGVLERNFWVSKFSPKVGSPQVWGIEEIGSEAIPLATTIAGSLAMVEAMAEEAEELELDLGWLEEGEEEGWKEEGNCPACNLGSCPNCNGQGQGHLSIIADCTDCTDGLCAICKGTGKV